MSDVARSKPLLISRSTASSLASATCYVRSSTSEILESQIGREDLGQESALTTTQEPSNFIFDVLAEGDDEPSRKDR